VSGPAEGTSFRPLEGVRVLDFSTNMAGPYATMILAQLGADVVKVESPSGDDARHWPPHENGASIVHRHMNAGKRGLTIDLGQEGGREAARRLAARADVLLQSMRPGVAERIGIGEAAIREANPGILYYALNAFGAGPAGRALPGYDPLVQAFSGIMRMTGHDGTPPARCAPSVIDLGTGQWIAMGVLAAVLARHRGQRVQAMETALVDTAFSLVPYQATTALMTGRRPKRAGSGNPIAAPYQVYSTRDGELMLAAPNQRLWERVVEVLGASHLLDDPRFATVAERSHNNAELDVALTALLAARDVDDWVARFRAAGVPVTRVGGLEESVRSDIAGERATFAELDGVPLVRLPWMVDGHAVPWSRPAPSLGEHTLEVLAEAGFSDAEMAELLRTGAALGPKQTAREAAA
jgi:crotonobetainyl-CoA:carnitine CoA-transferase CaiB-like acyl-CoA transferase